MDEKHQGEMEAVACHVKILYQSETYIFDKMPLLIQDHG